MKKSGKAPVTKKSTLKNTPKRRLATYIGGDLLDWIMEEVTRLDTNESHFIRSSLRTLKKQSEFSNL
jgi:hypothetical protein